MESIIKLMANRNHHLLKFKELNSTELINFSEGLFDNLETFYHARETILDIVRRIDEMINDAIASLEDSNPKATIEDKQVMMESMEMKNELVTEILSQDLQILSLIESEKSGIIKELKQVQTAKKALNSYQSKGRSSRVNEEV